MNRGFDQADRAWFITDPQQQKKHVDMEYNRNQLKANNLINLYGEAKDLVRSTAISKRDFQFSEHRQVNPTDKTTQIGLHVFFLTVSR